MRRGGWGRILCVTSITAKRPVDNLLLSNALRPAVAGFAHALARAVAKDGITVNTSSRGTHAPSGWSSSASAPRRRRDSPWPARRAPRVRGGGRVPRLGAGQLHHGRRGAGRRRLAPRHVLIASMTRPVTLFTGQWADLPLEELAAKLARWGFDGVELACWGDHFEIDRAVADPGYAKARGRSSSSTVSAAGRSERTSSGRPSATRSTRATGRSCRRRCGGTATRRACAAGPRSG